MTIHSDEISIPGTSQLDPLTSDRAIQRHQHHEHRDDD